MSEKVNVCGEKKVVVVTGGNKGIGFHTCRSLGGEGCIIILTSRSLMSAKLAVAKLRREFNVVAHSFSLDLTKSSSIETFATQVKEKFGRIDILINNAGVAIVVPDESSFIGYGEKKPLSFEDAKMTMEINYFGVVKLTETLIPLIPKSTGRIIFLSSRMGIMVAKHMDKKIRKKYYECSNFSEIGDILNEYCELVKKKGQFENGYKDGFIVLSYGLSKLAINLYSRLLRRRYKDHFFICCHPGFVETYMTRLSKNEKISASDAGNRISWCVNCDWEKYNGTFVNLDNNEIVNITLEE